ncbi:BTAD domain-containing putative transcriptional regulator [Micromonospora sp. URMC 103]|uniref:BTAD domain-containing putative transcriptional regulator n=1 Tax=Micromonospora sp. URMC 103 TaxID=3423406 RepID=UPI003F1DBFD4
MSSRTVRAFAVATSLLSTAAVPVIVARGTRAPALPALDAVRRWISQPWSTGFVTALAAVAALALWLLLATALFTHVYRALARRMLWRTPVRLPGPIQSLTAALLGATAVTTVAGATAHADQATTSGSDLPPAEPSTATLIPRVSDDANPPSAEPAPTYTVRRGDTLCRIAARTLGDADRWPEIYALNRGSHFPQVGGTLRDPNLIYPGWTLDLPTDATPPDRQPADPPQRHQGPRTDPGPRPSTPSTAPEPTGGATATAAASASPTIASPAPPDAGPSATRPGSAAAAPPTASAPSMSHAPTSSPSAGDPAPTRRPTGQPNQPYGILLPSGSWLDLGLAAAITAAVALVWAHRRRRYTRRPPSPNLRLDDPDLAPMPSVVNQIRRWLRRAGQAGPDTAKPGDAGPDLLDYPHARDVPDLGHRDAGVTDANLSGGGTAHEPFTGYVEGADDDLDGGDEQSPARRRHQEPDLAAPTGPRPVVPSLTHPLAVAWPPAGLGLTGPGADAAARGFLAAALAAGGPHASDERTWVIMPSTIAVTLLGADATALPDTPRLTVTASLDEALDLLDTQTLRRSRLVYAHEVDTVANLRAADSKTGPLPPILLLADASARRQRTRIAALLAQGQRLDIHGVLLGAWPDGDTITVSDDGTTTPGDSDAARHGRHPADIERLAILTPAETRDLLGTLAESHTGQPQTPPFVESAGTAEYHARPDASAARVASPSTTEAAGGPANPQPGPAGVSPELIVAEDCDRNAPLDSEPAEADASTPLNADGQHHQLSEPKPTATGTGTEETSEADGHEHAGRVQVNVLGPPEIAGAGPRPTLRKKSLEVLVYLAVHDGEARAEAILDDLLPDAPASKAPGRLYTYVSDLRAVMRRIGGPGTYLTHPNQRYALNHDRVDVDLWRMRAAIRDADHATTPQARVAALRRAVDAYRGHLADDATYEWIEPYREAVRQQALDAHLALVDALADDPAEQLTVLDPAIRHNPYAEELYQQAMRARAALGHLDAIRGLRRALTRALAEIDAEPSDATIALAEELIAEVQRPNSPHPRPVPRPSDGAAS